jgi:Mg/Co/Ni transporter MgtE
MAAAAPQVATPRRGGAGPAAPPAVNVAMLSTLAPEARTMVLAAMPPAQRWAVLAAMGEGERAEVAVAMSLVLRKEAAAALEPKVWDSTMDAVRANATLAARWVAARAGARC